MREVAAPSSASSAALSSATTSILHVPRPTIKNTSPPPLHPPPPPLQVGVMEEVSELQRHSEGPTSVSTLQASVLPIFLSCQIESRPDSLLNVERK